MFTTTVQLCGVGIVNLISSSRKSSDSTYSSSFTPLNHFRAHLSRVFKQIKFSKNAKIQFVNGISINQDTLKTGYNQCDETLGDRLPDQDSIDRGTPESLY